MCWAKAPWGGLTGREGAHREARIALLASEQMEEKAVLWRERRENAAEKQNCYAGTHR